MWMPDISVVHLQTEPWVVPAHKQISGSDLPTVDHLGSCSERFSATKLSLTLMTDGKLPWRRLVLKGLWMSWILVYSVVLTVTSDEITSKSVAAACSNNEPQEVLAKCSPFGLICLRHKRQQHGGLQWSTPKSCMHGPLPQHLCPLQRLQLTSSTKMVSILSMPWLSSNISSFLNLYPEPFMVLSWKTNRMERLGRIVSPDSRCQSWFQLQLWVDHYVWKPRKRITDLFHCHSWAKHPHVQCAQWNSSRLLQV